MNQRMYIPVECQQYSKGSKLNLLKKKNPAVEEKSSNKASSEAEPTVGQTEAFPAPPTEVWMTIDIVEKISLLNINEVLKSVTQDL